MCRQVETYMLDIMMSVFYEMESFPDELVHVVLGNILPEVRDENPAAYRCARHGVDRRTS